MSAFRPFGPRPDLDAIAPYRPLSARREGELALDGNEGPRPAHELLATWPPVSSSALRTYPSRAALAERLAARFGRRPDEVLVTAGSDDALDRVARAWLGPGEVAVGPEPTFAMIPRFVAVAGGRFGGIPWFEGPFPTEEIVARAVEAARVVFLVSPTNPTGRVVSARRVLELAARLPETLVVVDLAYVEFADEDPTAEVLEAPNVLVTRTFSKAWGLAGLRVGYALGSARVLEALERVGAPYPVAAPSLALAERCLIEGRTAHEEGVRRVREGRVALTAHLVRLGAQVSPSQGNFLLPRFRDAGFVHDGLRALGVRVRSFPERPELAHHLRITVPADAAEREDLEDALRTCCAPDALLFDLDGVLADVSRSYRDAILATAAHFGVALRARDVSRAKEGVGVNDDWELTRRLLAAAGRAVPYAAVREVFESIYQGTEDAPGLHARETPILSRDVLTRLLGARPAAVVTGRPRRDARRFLETHGLADRFRVLVAREDAPRLKPDPTPLHVALDRLGVAHAWMVGDTPDDLLAARAAGVLPIGVRAPGAPRSRALADAGAVRVLDRLTELEELLP